MAWHPKQPTVSTSSFPWAAFPLGCASGSAFGLDFNHRNSTIALISAALRLSKSTPLIVPLLLLLYQNRGMRASDLKSLGLASHLRTHSLVSLPDTVDRSGPILRTFS